MQQVKETWRKEKERQELHNLLLILDLLDLDHSEPEIHQEKVCTTLLEQSQLSGIRVFTTDPFLVHSETDIKELTNFDQSIK